MAFQKGKSGNPGGRPPKSRALTEILEKVGSEKITTAGGDVIEGRKMLARMLWGAALDGKAVLPNGTELEVAPRDWLEIVKFLYMQIDGPPKQSIKHEFEHLSDDELIALATGSVAGSR